MKNQQIQALRSEIMSAMQCLNMQPQPSYTPSDHGLLCEVDVWCADAKKHMLAAFDILAEYNEQKL